MTVPDLPTTKLHRLGGSLSPETIGLGAVWALVKKDLERYDERARVARERLTAIEREHARRYMEAVAKEGCHVIC